MFCANQNFYKMKTNCLSLKPKIWASLTRPKNSRTLFLEATQATSKTSMRGVGRLCNDPCLYCPVSRKVVLGIQSRSVYSSEEKQKNKPKEKFHYWDSKNKEGSGNPEENLNGEWRQYFWYKFTGFVNQNEELKKGFDEVTKQVVDPLKEKIHQTEEEAKRKLGFIAKPLEKVEETIRDTVQGTLSQKAKDEIAQKKKELRHKEMEWDDDKEEEADNEFVREAKKREKEAAKQRNSFANRLSNFTEGLKAELAEAAKGLYEHEPQSKMRASLKVQRPADGGDDAYADAQKKEAEEQAHINIEDTPGKGQLMVVKGQQTTWEKLGDRLREAPLIQQILKTGRIIGRSRIGKAAGSVRESINNRIEDVNEIWETSQNPIIYKLSATWDYLTSETEEAVAVRELRRLDPTFNPNEWKRDVVENFMPGFLEAFLKGDTRTLKEWCGEGAFNKLKQEIRKRKAEGLVLDHQVFAIENDDIVAIKAEEGTGRQEPAILVQLAAQQLNCVRNREGEVVEGAEDQIRSNIYLVAFQRQYNEKTGELIWYVADIMMVGAFPYL